MGREDVVHMHRRILLNCREQGIVTLSVKWMGLESIIVSEETQAQKDSIYSLSYADSIMAVYIYTYMYA